MMKTFKFITLLVLFALLLLPTRAAYAQGPNPDGGGQVIFGRSYTLKNGETYNGDLVVFGGNVTIEEQAVLNGELVVVGGTLESNGENNGDVVVVGGQIHLQESALVAGDVVTIGSQLQQAAGATIEGDIVNNVAPDFSFPTGTIPPIAPGEPNPPGIVRPNINISYSPFGEFMRIFGSALLVSMLGILATLFFQDRLARVSHAVVSQPLMTTSIGLLTVVVLLVAALTIILLPLVLLGLIPLGLAWLFGVVSMGQEIGERLSRALQKSWEPVITTGLGTFVLVFIIASIQSLDNLLPFMSCITWIVPAVVGLLAVGAIVVTRFGARSVPPRALTVYTPPSDPGQLPPAA